VGEYSGIFVLPYTTDRSIPGEQGIFFPVGIFGGLDLRYTRNGSPFRHQGKYSPCVPLGDRLFILNLEYQMSFVLLHTTKISLGRQGELFKVGYFMESLFFYVPHRDLPLGRGDYSR
jgi:hypothetical protein